jgi:hypothetical protein
MRRSRVRLAGACLLAAIAVITLNGCAESTAPLTPTTPSVSVADETTELGELIEAENAAVYAFGVIGAHLTGAQQSRALRALHAHERLRDTWIAGAEADGQEIPPAAVAYDLPIDVRDPASAEALWIDIERRLIEVYESAGAMAAEALAKSRARLARLTPAG